MMAAKAPIAKACFLAEQVNRIMGLIATPTPASSIAEVLASLPEAMKTALSATAGGDSLSTHGSV
jgi:ADP-dependent NAD(P)H-hydrate dehydratase / NAD(P)H-hydrate epimerase